MKNLVKQSLWLGRFLEEKAAVVAFFSLLLLLFILLLAPLLYRVDPNLTQAQAGFWAQPSAQHPLGTDDVGRDVLARLLYGGQVSLFIGFASAFLSISIGVPLGLLAGYRRGAWEYWIMRTVEVFQSFPSMVLILCLVSLVGPSLWNIIIVIGGLGWASLARLMYANTVAVAKQDYILAVRALGGGQGQILFRNILPNAIAPVWATLPMRVGRAMLAESGLSFLGLGLRTPQASWGNMLQKAIELPTLTQRPWFWIPPLLCIVFAIFALQFLADGLQRALNPREQ